MDDELKQLEAELKALQPAAPRRALFERLEAELATPVATAPVENKIVARPSRSWWAAAAAMPIAAAIAVAGYFVGRQGAKIPQLNPETPVVLTAPAVSGESPASQSPVVATAQPAKWEAVEITAEQAAQFKPVASENVLYAVKDEGLVTLEDGTAARRERLNYVDTITWKNPRTNASVKWTVPREEIRVVPVKFQ